VRIISGSARGMILASVGAGDSAAHLRPTSDRVRESLFNVLQNGALGGGVAGARVLDLFAGTGALGLEALSRGAAHAAFVDDGAKAIALIGENIGKMRAKETTQVLRRDATNLGQTRDAPFDLIFLDPPYGLLLGRKALASAAAGNWLAPGARIVWEENAPQLAPPGFSLVDHRRYGETHLTLLHFEALF
jgi:16S rRNA (guanine966-N2)-methyltransferase